MRIVQGVLVAGISVFWLGILLFVVGMPLGTSEAHHINCQQQPNHTHCRTATPTPTPTPAPDTIPPQYVSHSVTPPSGSATNTFDMTVTASDAGSGVLQIDVWVNDAPDGTGSGTWHKHTIWGPTGTVTVDMTTWAVGTYLINIDIFDNALNSTYWWQPHAHPNQVQTYTRTLPPPPPPPPPPSGQLVIDGQTGQTYSGMTISNPTGDCVIVRNSSTITLTNMTIGPCGGRGVFVHDSSTVTVENSYIHTEYRNGCCERGTAVFFLRVTGGWVEDSRLERSETLVAAHGGRDIHVLRNTGVDPLNTVDGKGPRGQLFQAVGPTAGQTTPVNVNIIGNTMTCNPAAGCRMEDGINLFEVNGALVQGNTITGGFSSSGCGIITEGGASNVVISDNDTVGQDAGLPGTDDGCGQAVAGGNNIKIELGYAAEYGNIAYYVWNQSGATCSGIQILNNVAGLRKDGTMNAFWNGGGCGTIVESGNSWQ